MSSTHENNASAGAETPNPFVSVIVPVHGGEQTLEPLVTSVKEAMDEAGWTWEMLLICDAPHDGSWRVAQRLAGTCDQLRAWRLERNYGQHAATLCGVRLAQGRFIATMDEDLQHDARDISRLIEACKGDMVVYGRARGATDRPVRTLVSALVKRSLKFMFRRGPPPVSGSFRVFPTHLRDAFADYSGPQVIVDALLYPHCKARAVLVDCTYRARHRGKSGYTVWRLALHAVALIYTFLAPRGDVAALARVAGVSALLGLAALLTINGVAPGAGMLAVTAKVALAGVSITCAIITACGVWHIRAMHSGRPHYVVAEEAIAGIDNNATTSPSRSPAVDSGRRAAGMQ